jgi:Copper type II ascorbate-dependent monooxygenase, C-terminal domain
MRKFAALVPALFVALGAACGSSSNSGGQDMGPPGSYSVTFGPIDVASKLENTQCVVKRLGNATTMHVGTIHNVLGTASHHMIVYKVADTVEQPTPFDCRPFVDTLDPSKGSPLMITQKKEEILTLPQGVAYTLGPNQMVRIEMHYINATPSTQSLSATATFTPIADADYKYDADFLFIGDPDINVPAMSQKTLGPIFYQLDADYDGVNFFALTGHEHQFGTNVKIWTAANAADPGTPVYDIPGWQWAEPTTKFQDPPFQIPAGGGFKFTCDWNNTSTAAVRFGESANDEMCFFWAYYYPSKGARVCVHTDQVTGGRDLCCPGDALCAFIM